MLDWKLNGRSEAIRWLLHTAGGRLTETFSPDDLLLPVPMPLSRMRSAAQHHTADLCRWISRETGCSWDWRLLRRRGEQVRQSALPARQRRKNLRKAFALDHDHWQRLATHWNADRRLWIVDDIMTTGTTLREAARALRILRQPVHVFSIARAPLKG